MVEFEATPFRRGDLVTLYDNLREATESDDQYAEERVLKSALIKGDIK
jgi:hypothetical protein